MGHFFLGTWPQNSKKNRVDDQAQTPLGILAKFLAESELDKYFLGSCAACSEEIQERPADSSSKQQTLAFRYRRRSPPELGYRGGECRTCRPLPVVLLSLSLSI